MLSFNELNSKFKSYNVVIGFYEYGRAKEIIYSEAFKSKGIIAFWDDFEKFDYNYVKDNIEKFKETYNLLEDELSKKIYFSYIKARLSKIPNDLVQFCSKPQYFCEFMNIGQNEIFVDCGAYDGDTLKNFFDIEHGKYNKIYAFEPESNNYDELLKNTCNIHSVNLINKGTWKKDTVLKFSSDGTSSALNDNCDIEIEVTSIDETVGLDEVTFIKMDIEGSELATLKGAEKTIKRCMPKLAICVYHKPEDLITIPQYIKKFNLSNKKYKLYLRHHSMSSNETVLYAVPTEY